MWSLARRMVLNAAQRPHPVAFNGSPKNWFHALVRPNIITPAALAPSGVSSSGSAISEWATHLLRPAFLPLYSLVNGFKVKGRLKRRCKDCYFVVRQERTYVICKTHPRHKQMSQMKKPKNLWILTDATQSKVRQW